MAQRYGDMTIWHMHTDTASALRFASAIAIAVAATDTATDTATTTTTATATTTATTTSTTTEPDISGKGNTSIGISACLLPRNYAQLTLVLLIIAY